MSDATSGGAPTLTIHLRRPPEGERPQADGSTGGAAEGQGYLVVVEAGSSSIFPLPPSGEVLIGRAKEAQLQLRDPSASRLHARLLLGEGGPRIADLGSHNGTRVNGERIEGPRALGSGDVVGICDVTLVVQGAPRAALQRPLFLELTPLRQRLEEELDRALATRRPVTLLVVSFSAGKPGAAGKSGGPPPDQAGPARGETLAAALAPALRPGDVAALSGAAELLLLLPDLDEEDGDEAAARTLRAVEPSCPGARAGCATCPADGADADTLIQAARAAADLAPPGRALRAAAAVTRTQVGGRDVIVADPAMLRLYGLIDRLAQSDLPVLIHGETGAGKELAAQALHERSRRGKGRLVSLNCAALPESLAEGELFGYEKGAFSGAASSKPGLLEAASGGTVFLDEVGELPLPIQAKLLRALESRRVQRLGDLREREVDIRIVAATNRDLDKEVAAGRFRQDLYFRLGAAVLVLPPLRDRRRELPLLVRAFLAEACARAGREVPVLSPAAMERLRAYAWPGNVRELRNVMDYLAATATEDLIEPAQLPERLLGASPAIAAPALGEGASLRQIARAVLRTALPDKLEAVEEALISEALTLCEGNKSAAARLLGVHRKVIERRVK